MKEQKPREERLWSKISYGCADIYGGGAFVVISTFFTVFLTKALGMPPALAGTIPLIGKVWDAVNDPIMGAIADRTKSKYGSKRFWLLVGAISSAISFIALWIPFKVGGVVGQYIFYVVMYLLFSTGATIVMVPYNGLLPDMIDDYTLRAKYSATRMAFSSFGAIIAGLIPTLMIRDNTNATQYLVVAILFSVIFFVSVFLTFLGTWERDKNLHESSMKEAFTESITVFKSYSFRLLTGMFIFGQGAADFLTGLAVYYIDDVLNAYGGGNFTILMGVLLIGQFLGMLLFGPIMAKTSKKFPILAGTPVRILATLAMLAFSYEGANFTIILILAFIVGLGMAGTSTSIFAILADIADVDELITSISRPSTCSSMATFARQLAAGLTSALIGVLLAMVGYDEVLAASGARQALATQRGIALIFVFTQVIFMIITLLFTMKFPVTKKEFQIVRKEIARRKGEDDSIITDEEIRVCEKVTGLSYDRLWDKNNAFKIKN